MMHKGKHMHARSVLAEQRAKSYKSRAAGVAPMHPVII